MILRWSLVVALLGAALVLLNAAVFNTWAAGGPPTPHPELYWQRAVWLYRAAAACVAAAVASFILVRPGR